METAFLGLGANLGDRLANLQAAADLLAAGDGVHVVRSSRVYETSPVGPPQPDFLNAVLEVRTSRSPRELLRACLAIEDRLGRIRAERWGPRTIDVDVLALGPVRVEEPDLVVPHPRLAQRAFVLVPLLELAPDLELPGIGPLTALPVPDGEVRPVHPPLIVAPEGAVEAGRSS
ncbi:MAG TPA: 2-amino-4-hydroxy-6-hydroxymethyldihydropteridine diphosphokinase [Actinomycetota bacterium]|nr:2-amino-4-hydroxy-6-hydroxymethyldihydropteridine diphosphokinase [Actinomycetota bacterium]